MLDRVIELSEDWQSAWIDREYIPLLAYILHFSLLMSFLTCTLGVIGAFKTRRLARQLDGAESEERDRIKAEMNKRSLKVTKALLYVASIYVIHALAIIFVDTAIAVFALKKDMDEDPTAWTTELIIEVALYSVFLLILFLATFFLFPLLQLLVAAKAAARWHANTPRAEFLNQARMSSTQLAHMWCILTYVIVGFWSINDYCLWRYVIVQVCMGSAMVWLEVASMLNFSTEKVLQEQLAVYRRPSSIRETYVVFVNSMGVHYSRQPVIGELPKYEDEKVPLIDTTETA